MASLACFVEWRGIGGQDYPRYPHVVENLASVVEAVSRSDLCRAASGGPAGFPGRGDFWGKRKLPRAVADPGELNFRTRFVPRP